MSFSAVPIRSNADAVDVSWWNSLRAAGVVLESMGSGIGYQEPLGTGDGVSTSFGPLSFTPVTEDSIAVYRNGLIVPKAEWSLSGADILFSSAPVAAQDIYAYYMISGTATPVTPPGVENVLYRTLTGGEAAAKSLTLPATPISASKVKVDVMGGLGAVEYAVDFTVSGATFSWTGLGLDGLLSAGDKLRIVYLS